jgi:hypothetical protein
MFSAAIWRLIWLASGVMPAQWDVSATPASGRADDKREGLS